MECFAIFSSGNRTLTLLIQLMISLMTGSLALLNPPAAYCQIAVLSFIDVYRYFGVSSTIVNISVAHVLSQR